MLDEFGSRQRIIPAEVRGPLRQWRTRVYGVLLLILVILPWLRINGMQAVWLDLPARRFEIFGFLFLSHDAPLLFFILILAALSLVMVTAIWGRVWCGWACPQTVFIDAVYRRIEIWIEGDYIQRRKLAARPMDLEKLGKLALKWILYFVISSVIAHSVMAYFAGSSRLIEMMKGPPSENWAYFLFATVITLLLMFNFGWFREQFCVIMCPYGRFQSVLMDKRTVTVVYDEKRGEPRKGKVDGPAKGDCIDCGRCVQVCPVKIDIRDGVQMECISCTACIDACNEIMRKVKKPEGLISHRAINPSGSLFLRPRIILYAILMLFLSTALVYSLATRKSFSLAVLRATDIPYQIMSEGRVLNHFKSHYMNQSVQAQQIEFSLQPEDIARGLTMTQAGSVYVVQPGGSVQPHLFVTFPAQAFDAKGEAIFKIQVRDRITGKLEVIEAKAVGPYSAGS